jgi:hypothetical protein
MSDGEEQLPPPPTAAPRMKGVASELSPGPVGGRPSIMARNASDGFIRARVAKGVDAAAVLHDTSTTDGGLLEDIAHYHDGVSTSEARARREELLKRFSKHDLYCLATEAIEAVAAKDRAELLKTRRMGDRRKRRKNDKRKSDKGAKKKERSSATGGGSDRGSDREGVGGGAKFKRRTSADNLKDAMLKRLHDTDAEGDDHDHDDYDDHDQAGLASDHTTYDTDSTEASSGAGRLGVPRAISSENEFASATDLEAFHSPRGDGGGQFGAMTEGETSASEADDKDDDDDDDVSENDELIDARFEREAVEAEDVMHLDEALQHLTSAVQLNHAANVLATDEDLGGELGFEVFTKHLDLVDEEFDELAELVADEDKQVEHTDRTTMLDVSFF